MVSTCKDCGSRLDAFGMCPNTSPQDAAIMAAPVFCGKRSLISPERAIEIVREIHPNTTRDSSLARHYSRLAHIDYAEAYRMPRPTGMNEALMESAYLHRARAIQLGGSASEIDRHFADVRERWGKAVA